MVSDRVCMDDVRKSEHRTPLVLNQWLQAYVQPELIPPSAYVSQ